MAQLFVFPKKDRKKPQWRFPAVTNLALRLLIFNLLAATYGPEWDEGALN